MVSLRDIGAPMAAAVLPLWLGACAVGTGEGEVMGEVHAPECGLEGGQFDLGPTFFAADPKEELLEIRVQRGSNFVDRSDGVQITVRDANEVKSRLGEALDLSLPDDERLVDIGLYLNDRCSVSDDSTPVNYTSRSGTIVFESIYAPQVAEDEVEIEASFENVRLDDRFSPDERFAILEGEFEFLFTRGRPVQRFP